MLNDYEFQPQFEILDRAVLCVIKYTGTEEKASQFKYKFKLGIGSDKISVCNTVSSYSVDVQEVYNTGKCVQLYCDTPERFLDEKDSLKFSLKFLVCMFITVSTNKHRPYSKICHIIIIIKYRNTLFVVVEMCRMVSEIQQENSSLTSYF
jgi:hypothetical protein